MKNRPLKPVTTTIARAMLAILLLSVVTTSFALLTLASSLNDAEAVNVSGSLRMQSYRLAYDIQTQSPHLEAHLDMFEKSLFSPSMAALEHWTVPTNIKMHYYNLIGRWEDLHPLLHDGNERLFLSEVAKFVDRIDQFVYELQEFSIIKLQVLSVVGGLGLSLILIAALFTIHFTQRKIVTPLNQMVTASEQIQEGKFDLTLDVKSDNELGILAGTFTTMATELGKLYRNLEMKVDEKTRRLRQANDSLQVLYDCSQELSQSRLSTKNFAVMLETLLDIEGLTAAKLIIEESSGNNTEITAGEPSGNNWHYHDLELDGQVLGQLWWQDTLPCPDKSLIENISRTLARGIYYNRAQKQSEQLLLMEERATIARELHDSLAQSLSYLKIQVTLLKRQLGQGDQQQTMAIISDIDHGLSGAYTQLRELLSTFRLTIKEANFGEALVEMLKPLEEQSNALLIIDNQLSSLSLDAHHQVHLLQLIREAALNAIKHAQADEIIVTCLQELDTVTITISDDGIGFNPADEKLNHYGLAIMTERASRLHGTLEINTTKGTGCEVTLQFQPESQG
ncbi:nitrate/nitrite two-component system sensor histidine kinase NarQ [Photobacterium sp. BZF1]|uniref:Sensor protein n=1 Tax=Photobacterium rosenbergii TaxID=294936 RepID=A0A2T3NB78_9GAMM|nr:nitrate/nitrite two-component system sensor histidine kinase NarQ [Photobacterium rosenbergii]MBC7002044.1 nitrate/nitrite two-component system sensor histidine kinase NarQ [Photobacterium sp. BZF1]MBY5947264.1 nitrate/nitrite two-component system sensor histidine kinase NarQ [Photobacterium rosenbergii]PSW11096.1 nitrate/nitrite two-component system sensor histidine kinase NarQ [Photobacterium rosenbergii]